MKRQTIDLDDKVFEKIRKKAFDKKTTAKKISEGIINDYITEKK